MYTNILVPVVFDHGAHSANSLNAAQALLSEGGQITLLHVLEEVPTYASNYLPEGLAESRQQEALNGLNDIARQNGVSCKAAVSHGHGYSSILAYSEKHGCDCIVIASHKPGFEDYFLGSTAARVVRHAKCGVHILR
ncbi:MAG: universal stress protein [Pseudomonadota bacterium]